MCAVDLANLQLKEENVEVNVDEYKDPSEFPPPIEDGIYDFIQGKPEFESTSAGYLSAAMTHEVVGGPHDKARVSFDRISNKPFERQGVKVNMMTDHLRAIGDRGRYTSHQAYADAIAAGEGKTFKAQTQWDGYCNHKDTEFAEGQAQAAAAFTIRGQKSFPSNGSGNIPEKPCPTCGKAVQARTRISRRIPKEEV